jgi:hypothetical protein
MENQKASDEDVYTYFQAEQVALENPDSFWSKFFTAPFKKVNSKIKRKKKVYSFAEKREMVKKRNLKKNSTKRK